MKYLKKYEDKTEYKIGDYLKIESNNKRIKPYHIVEIVDIDFHSYTVKYIEQNINKVRWINIRFHSDTIKRLATQEEIIEYNNMIDTLENLNKYNL